MDLNDILLEPGKAYNEYYKAQHQKNAEELFEELVKKSGVDAEENRRLAKEYRQTANEAEEMNARLKRWKLLRTLLIIVAVVGGVLCCLGVSQNNLLMAILSPGASIISLLLIFLVLKKKIAFFQKEYDTVKARADQLYRQALGMLAPLFSLFRREMTHDLIMKTVPQLKIDRHFTPERFDYLYGKYGYGTRIDTEGSTSHVVSGEMVGNPFLFERKRRHRMGKQAYVGTRTIHWTTYSRDANGKTVAHHHTQVLHATVVKPKPFYSSETSLVYANDAAPDLSFSHDPSHAERFSEKELRSKVKSGIKKVRKTAKKRIAEGFTEMGNEEFDVLFGAMDRDHEVQFRLLYTVLAQKNTLELMKGASPYGDDFRFIKKGCLNSIISEHAQRWNMDVETERYHSYDIDLCRQLFVNLNAEYFTNMYFDLAPILAIPLYQQYRPTEYQCAGNYKYHFTLQEAEALANRIGDRAFAHPSSATPAILKPEFLSSDKDVDYLRITAFSYRTVHRVDFIPVFGGDGRMHSVPVPWIQYIPLSRTGEMKMTFLNIDEKDYENSDFAESEQPHAFWGGLFATMERAGEMLDSAPGEQDTDISEYGGVVETDAPADAENGEADSGNASLDED